MYIYGVYDRKSARYTNTYTDYKNESAERTFLTLCQDKSTYIGLYPEDYELWLLADLDEQSGEIKPGKEYIVTGRRETQNNVLFKGKPTENNRE